MSASEAVSLADIFRTFFPLIAASARSLAFFFSFASVTPSSMVSRVFWAFSFVSVAFWLGEGDCWLGEGLFEPLESAVEHTSFSFSPLPDPGTTESASLVPPPVQFAHVHVFPLLDAYVLAAHVQYSAVPPVLSEPSGQV